MLFPLLPHHCSSFFENPKVASDTFDTDGVREDYRQYYVRRSMGLGIIGVAFSALSLISYLFKKRIYTRTGLSCHSVSLLTPIASLISFTALIYAYDFAYQANTLEGVSKYIEKRYNEWDKRKEGKNNGME